MENIIDKIKLLSTGETYDIVGRKPSEIETLQEALANLTTLVSALKEKVDGLYYDIHPDEKPNGSGSGSGSGNVTEP